MRNFLVSSLVLAIALTAQAKASQLDDVFLSAFINDIKQVAELPSGTAIAVIQNDKIIYQGNFGYQDIQKKIKVGPKTQFYIASVTKPFTALNALLDADAGKISLDTSVEQMFPEFSIASRKAATVGDLLTHKASINNLPLVLATAYSGEHTPKSLKALVNQTSEMSSEDMGTFKYTNVGYNIYSVYSDGHFEQSWQEKLQQQVFVPANMLNTTAKTSMLDGMSNIAKPYSLMSHKRSSALYFIKGDKTMHAAGGMYSTASDLGQFIIAQLNQGKIAEQQVYPADVIARSQQRQVTTDKSYMDFKRDGYAWGWYTGEYKGQRMLHHFGGFAGAHAHLSFIPEKKLGLVIVNNEDFLSSRLASIVADFVYGSLLGEMSVKEKVQKRVADIKAKLSGLDNMLNKEQQKITARKWALSRSAEEYVGEYVHPLLGTIEVTLNKQDRFDVKWGMMYSDSTGMNEVDKVRVEMEPNNGSIITFNVNPLVKSLNYAGHQFKKQNQ